MMFLAAQIIAWFSLTVSVLAAGQALGKSNRTDALVHALGAGLNLVLVGVLMGWWA